MATPSFSEDGGAKQGEFRLIDCDVHPALSGGLSDLLPYLSSSWRERVGGNSAQRASRSVNFNIPKADIYINPVGRIRRDCVPDDGSVPASDPGLVAKHLLDAYCIDRAVLLGNNMIGLGALPDPDLAAAIAAAHNDWLEEKWLQADSRYRGAIVVAPQDPEKAAQEIDRLASRRGFVQILMPMMNVLMGDRRFLPIYAAAQRNALPLGVHVNAVEASFALGPQMAGGIPTYYVEWHADLPHVFQANLISLVCQGVLERFPDLRVVIAEGGVGWIGDVMWRLDKDWKGLRDELPWIRKPPSEYIKEQVRFTTQPFVEPPRKEFLLSLMEMIEAERTLVFSSDYPHWDFDNPTTVLSQLPQRMQRRIFVENASDLYGDRL